LLREQARRGAGSAFAGDIFFLSSVMPPDRWHQAPLQVAVTFHYFAANRYYGRAENRTEIGEERNTLIEKALALMLLQAAAR